MLFKLWKLIFGSAEIKVEDNPPATILYTQTGYYWSSKQLEWNGPYSTYELADAAQKKARQI